MIIMREIITLPIIAFAVTAIIMPLVRKLSIKIGNVDKPREDCRKIHSYAIPNGAGIAIYAGFVVATLLLGGLSIEIVSLLIAGLLLVIVGTFDEKYDMSSFSRILFQVLAATIVIAAGIKVDVIGNFGNGNDGLFYLGFLSIPFTLFWIVGVTNAIRILDGLDGLAGGVTAISALTLGVVALITGRNDAAILSFILCAVSIAYLPYNFSKNPKRKTFMADAGSNFLGFALATVSIMGSVKTAAAFSMIVPIMVLIIPIFDTLFAIARRLIAGKSPFKADGMHLHHRLLKMGLSQTKVTGIFYVASILLGILAIFSTKMSGFSTVAVFIVAGLVFIMVLVKFKLIRIFRRRF